MRVWGKRNGNCITKIATCVELLFVLIWLNNHYSVNLDEIKKIKWSNIGNLKGKPNFQITWKKKDTLIQPLHIDPIKTWLEQTDLLCFQRKTWREMFRFKKIPTTLVDIGSRPTQMRVSYTFNLPNDDAEINICHWQKKNLGSDKMFCNCHKSGTVTQSQSFQIDQS